MIPEAKTAAVGRAAQQEAFGVNELEDIRAPRGLAALSSFSLWYAATKVDTSSHCIAVLAHSSNEL
jgi:hypothetical protein